jgi:hypothetical protein
MAMQRTIEEIGEFANAAKGVSADGKGPKHAVFTEGQFLLLGDGLEARQALFCGTSDEEEFIEIALAREFGFLIRQADILREFSRAKRSQRDNGYTGGLAKRFQSVL